MQADCTVPDKHRPAAGNKSGKGTPGEGAVLLRAVQKVLRARCRVFTGAEAEGFSASRLILGPPRVVCGACPFSKKLRAPRVHAVRARQLRRLPFLGAPLPPGPPRADCGACPLCTCTLLPPGGLLVGRRPHSHAPAVRANCEQLYIQARLKGRARSFWPVAPACCAGPMILVWARSLSLFGAGPTFIWACCQ